MADLNNTIIRGSLRVISDFYADTIYEGGTALSNKYLGISSKAADSDLLDGHDSSYFINTSNIGSQSVNYANYSYCADFITSHDTRNSNPTPQEEYKGLKATFQANDSDGLSDGGSYHGVLHFRSYGDNGDLNGGYPIQIAYTASGNIWTRMGTGSTTWGSWTKLAYSGESQPANGGNADTVDGEHSSAFLHVTGGDMTGTLRAVSNASDVEPVYAAIEVREYNRQTTAVAETYANAPRIGFHWGGRYYANLAYIEDEFRFINYNALGYRPVRASVFYENDVALSSKYQPIGNYAGTSVATQSANGLMSATDKTNLDAIVASLNDDDSDSVVNRLKDILSVFQDYPEGTTVLSALNSKLNLSGGTLSGAVTFANSTYNTVGDDSQIGDIDVAGTLGLRGYNGQTALAFVNQYGSSYGQYRTRLVAPVVTENHDIYLPGAGGTLALLSDIPSSLPANGGNADTVDGLHADAFYRSTNPSGFVNHDYYHSPVWPSQATISKVQIATGQGGAADMYLPVASSSDYGLIKLGYTESGKNYAVQLDSNGKAYVYVPWESGSGGGSGDYLGINGGTATGTFTLNGANVSGTGYDIIIQSKVNANVVLAAEAGGVVISTGGSQNSAVVLKSPANSAYTANFPAKSSAQTFAFVEDTKLYWHTIQLTSSSNSNIMAWFTFISHKSSAYTYAQLVSEFAAERHVSGTYQSLSSGSVPTYQYRSVVSVSVSSSSLVIKYQSTISNQTTTTFDSNSDLRDSVAEVS